MLSAEKEIKVLKVREREGLGREVSSPEGRNFCAETGKK